MKTEASGDKDLRLARAARVRIAILELRRARKEAASLEKQIVAELKTEQRLTTYQFLLTSESGINLLADIVIPSASDMKPTIDIKVLRTLDPDRGGLKALHPTGKGSTA